MLNLDAKESKILKELLSLDMDRIGFNDRETKILRGIYEKLDNKKTTEKKSPEPFKVGKTKL
jgi:hypothetical protein